MHSEKKQRAVLFCEGALTNLLGKTAHGLLRYSPKYDVAAVVDSMHAGEDAGLLVLGQRRGIYVFKSLTEAVEQMKVKPEVLIIAMAPTGYGKVGVIIDAASEAISLGMDIHSGLHLFLSEVAEIASAARDHGRTVIDIRKPPQRPLHMFTGEILSVNAPRLLVTGQDAASGKRTTCIRLRDALDEVGISAVLVGTGQTAWLQGFEYGVRLDALPLDFAAGELEAEVVRAASETNADLIIVEGQGSLLNPGYSPETMVLLTACRPSWVVYVATPGRTCYVDFPDFSLPKVSDEIKIIELISGAQVVGQVVNDSLALWEEEVFPAPTVSGVQGDMKIIALEIFGLIKRKHSA